MIEVWWLSAVAGVVMGAVGLVIVERWQSQRRRAAEAAAGLTCSFCGKGQREVKKLIAGPAVYICDECVGLCVQIIQEHDQKPPIEVKPAEHEWSPPEKE